jgi:hypothetical protein
MFEKVWWLRSVSKQELDRICDKNIKQIMGLFAQTTKFCANCSYPISMTEEAFNSTAAGGKVCDLCHAMEAAISRQWFVNKHNEWMAEQNNKKRKIHLD